MTAEKMNMLMRRDVKPGGGTNFMIYQNHANLKKHLAEMRPMMNFRTNDHNLREQLSSTEFLAYLRHRETEKLHKENDRLFGRLLSIYEVSSFCPK